MSKRDEYIQKTKKALDELNAELAKLEQGIDNTVDGMDEKRKEMLARMHEQSDTMKARLKELQGKGENSWEGIKDEVEHVRKAFVHSFNYFKSQV